MVLWRRLRNRQLGGHKFRRQEPVGRFVLDLACREARLAVEVDGSQHLEDRAMRRDEERTSFLETEGWRVLRVRNDDVLRRTDLVLNAILEAAGRPSPRPSP
jgi:very-short-patch-repair endonuclease